MASRCYVLSHSLYILCLKEKWTCIPNLGVLALTRIGPRKRKAFCIQNSFSAVGINKKYLAPSDSWAAVLCRICLISSKLGRLYWSIWVTITTQYDAWPPWDILCMKERFAAQGQWSAIYHKQSFDKALNTTFLLASLLWRTYVALNLKRSWVPKATTFSIMAVRISSRSLSIFSEFFLSLS